MLLTSTILAATSTTGGEEESSNFLVSPDVGLMIWTVLAFLVALFILRHRDPAAPRPFRVPLYPVLPLAFVLSCAYVLYSSIVHAQTEHATYIAFAVMLSGVIALLLLRRQR